MKDNGVTNINGAANAPTSIGSPPAVVSDKPKPTGIPGSPPAPMKQAMPTPPPPQEVAEKPKPTGIAASKPIPATPPVAPPVIKAASVMPGTIRKGIEVSAAELLRKFPATPQETIAKAIVILRGTIVETLNGAICSQWGSQAQKVYGTLVEESLRLTSSATVRDGMRHASRLYTILGEVGATFQNGGSKGFLHWGKSLTPWEKLTEVRIELDQLRVYLGSILDELRTTQTRLEAIMQELADHTNDLDASNIAAQVIVDHIGMNDSRAPHLLTQCQSLTKTMAQIADGVLVRQATIDQIDALADKIQESILVTLPAWIEKVAFTFQQSSVTETERYSLGQGLEEILNQLK